MTSSHSPEEQLDDLLFERRRDLDVQLARLAETVAGLERREELVRDSRASVERVLRVGSNELDLRESELADLIREVTAREERLRAAEEELAQRRSELGAVELKREAVERRERVLAERQAQIEARETALAETVSTGHGVASLVFVPGVSYELVEIESTPLAPGAAFDLEGEHYEVVRVGPSPLPADNRCCAYLARRIQIPNRGQAEA